MKTAARATGVGAFAVLGLITLGLTVTTVPAYAHHSFSMFDPDRLVTLTGTVTDFEWTNPHAQLHLLVEDENGRPVEWSFEMQGLGQIVRTGWMPNSLKPGDKVTVEIRPMRSGARGGQLLSARLPDGELIGAAAPPASR